VTSLRDLTNVYNDHFLRPDCLLFT
jgi:hypothetical protein